MAYDRFFAGLLVLVLVVKAPGGLADIGRRLWRRVEGRGDRTERIVMDRPRAVTLPAPAQAVLLAPAETA